MLQHNNSAVSPMSVSLLFDINPPFQSSSVLELDIMASTRCLMKIHEEVTVALKLAAMLCYPVCQITTTASRNAVRWFPDDTTADLAAAYAVSPTGFI
jgi:hypothetical protein